MICALVAGQVAAGLLILAAGGRSTSSWAVAAGSRNGLAGHGQATAGMVLGIIAVLAGIGFWVAAVAVSA